MRTKEINRIPARIYAPSALIPAFCSIFLASGGVALTLCAVFFDVAIIIILLYFHSKGRI